MNNSLHTHVESQYDTANDVKKMCARFKEIGADGFCLTEHYVVSSRDDVAEIAHAMDLKLVAGVEVGRNHQVWLPKDAIGQKAIDKAVTLSNGNINSHKIPEVTPEIMVNCFGPGSTGHGHVIALSACIQSAPGRKLLSNYAIEKEIRKLQNKQSTAINPEAKEVTAIKEALEKQIAALDAITAEYKNAQELAKKTYKARETKLNKLAKAGTDVSKELDALRQEQLESLKARESLETLKNRQTAAKNAVKEIKTKADVVNASVDKWLKYEAEIKNHEASILSQEERETAVNGMLQWYDKIFGHGNFYVELQNHGMPEEAEVFPVLARLAQKLGIEMVATNDVHIITNSEDDVLARNIIRSFRYNSWTEITPADRELYIKTDEQLKEILVRILPEDVVDKAIENNQKVFGMCYDYQIVKEEHYPKAKNLEGKTAEEMCRIKSLEGGHKIFGEEIPDEYMERLEYELDVICKMGYANYHLIVADFLTYARIIGHVPYDRLDEVPLTIEGAKKFVEDNGWKVGMGVGPGRGSACGSLVCYFMGITAIDPIKYDLQFERYLNVERVTMPDIDSDFAKGVREKTLEYVKNLYGQKAVCCIMTKQYEAPKGAIRDAARIYSDKVAGNTIEFADLADEMTKLVPTEVGVSFATPVAIIKGGKRYADASTIPGGKYASLQDAVDEGLIAITVAESLEEKYTDDEDAMTILHWAKLIEGKFTVYGQHAAGVVISDNDDISEYVPLRINTSSGELTTQCDMSKVEENGLLKMDFLGLINLNVMSDCEHFIEKQKGICIDMERDCTFEPEVFEKIFAQGNTNSVFQFESPGMKNMLKSFKPASYEDLTLLVAAYRPGPMQYLKKICDIKNGKADVTYADARLEKVLGVTYGATVYQEQVMKICQILAGYSLGKADLVRRYMSKKKKDKLAHEREAFIYGDPDRDIIGCVNNGVSESTANQIFDEMMDFAKYAFNKSHAAAYALVAYYTGWLKFYYPVEYFAAALNWAGNIDEITALIREAKNFGVEVKTPNINFSQIGFEPVGNEIVFGIGSIKGAGKSVLPIIKEREVNGPYTTLYDFLYRTNTKAGMAYKLIESGTLDCFGNSRDALKVAAKVYIENIEKIHKKEVAILEATGKKLENARKALEELKADCAEFVMPDIDDNLRVRLNAEAALLGMYISGSPLESYPTPEEADVQSIDTVTGEGNTEIMGMITDLVVSKSKKTGADMAFFNVTDGTGIMRCALFSEYEKYKGLLAEGNVFIFNGKVITRRKFGSDEEELSLIVRDIKALAEKKKRVVMYVDTMKEFIETYMHKIDAYKEDGGRKLLLYVSETGVLKEFKFKVSERILESELPVKEER